MSKDKAKLPTFSGPVVLGIHSNIAGDEHSFTSGHAWISVQEGSKTIYFGLWPDGHPRTVDNKGKSDVRVDMEAGSRPAASRFYRLSKVRTKRLNAFLKKRVHWDYTHNCSSWASDLSTVLLGLMLMPMIGSVLKHHVSSAPQSRRWNLSKRQAVTHRHPLEMCNKAV